MIKLGPFSDVDFSRFISCYEKCGFILTPGKSVPFSVGNNHWIAFNMTVEEAAWKKNNRAI